MKKTATQRMLPVDLTEEERATKAGELAKKLADYDSLEQDKKDRTKDITDKMKQTRQEYTKLRREVSSGKTDRLTDCWTEPNLVRRCWVVIRADTGEVVEDYPMTAQEIDEARQIDFTREKNAKGDEAGV